MQKNKNKLSNFLYKLAAGGRVGYSIETFSHMQQLALFPFNIFFF
jgi:hypothetical protein